MFIILKLHNFRGQLMKISKNKFFSEATLKICSSLEVESFLFESFVYIKKSLNLPADYASIIYVSADNSKLNILAIATEKGGLLYQDSVAISESKQKIFSDKIFNQEITITDTLDEHPLAGLWLKKGYTNNTPQLSLRLDIENQLIGTVNFLSYGENRFTDEHAEMISLLKEPFTIAVSNGLRFQELNKLKENLTEDNDFLHNELRMVKGNEIVGVDNGLKGVMDMVNQVAHLSSPVLLLGETGTGKEIIANVIHKYSNRKEQPFIKINCGAIPENLVDSELFGYEKGAFTGAVTRKKGRFERAHNGTLFLDEVGELPLDVQVRLLRALQEKEIERVGGTDPVKVNIRIVAATNRNLTKLVQEGKFRKDLYFRLNVFPIVIPPLRDRKSDIIGLVHHFIQKKTREMRLENFPSLSTIAHEQLLNYSWPGNVRELENVVERAIILGRNRPISFSELSETISMEPKEEEYKKTEKQNINYETKEKESLGLDEVTSKHIRSVLEMTNGKVHGTNGAAEYLKINPSTLRNKMRKLGIPFGKNRK